MTISFAALMAAKVSFMRSFGFGFTVAVLADATLVRMALVAAFRHVLGRSKLVGAETVGPRATGGAVYTERPCE